MTSTRTVLLRKSVSPYCVLRLCGYAAGTHSSNCNRLELKYTRSRDRGGGGGAKKHKKKQYKLTGTR
jgi:hypothetical protein